MSNLCSLNVILLTLMLLINTKLLASADKPHQNSSAVSNDNICNNKAGNVAFDVINKKIVKRQVPQIIADKHARPRTDQKSLLIIFDGTGSMHDDLQQLRSGAQEIINDLSSRNDSPIFNYVLVVYRDPNVDPPFDTQNPSELLEKLKFINVTGGGDCPELALNGLRIALQYALPNSLAYVFSDATAKDYGFYQDVVELIQKKQVSVNFLLTGDCNAQNSFGYQVYHKLSRVSNGQVYDMNKNNVKDVLLAIRHSVSHNYAALKSLDVESSGTSQTDLNVDKSISELSVRISGKNPKLSIKDPSNETVNSGDELSLENLKLVNIKDPKDGVWRIETGAESAHSVRLSGLSDLKFDFGFSAGEVTRKSETSFLPLSGFKNVLSIFISDPSLIESLKNVTIALVPASPSDLSLKFTLALKKVNDQIYATNAFDVPRQMFKIQLNGIDANGNAIERLISTGLIANNGNPPEVKIETKKSELYEDQTLTLKCIASSQIPVEIFWKFRGQILKKMFSNQSNELELKINDVKQNHNGAYSCLATNKLGNDSKEIIISILKYPKVKIHQDEEEMIENTEYSLRCSIENAHNEYSMSWHEENGTLLQNNSPVYKFIARADDNNKHITCRITNDEFLIEDSTTLQVNFLPKFSNDAIFDPNVRIIYGESLSLSCVTNQNPPVQKIQWFLTQNETRELSIHDPMLNIREVNEDHEGVYECSVQNKIGKTQRRFNVEVLPKDLNFDITVNSEIVIANETESIELYCGCENCLPITNYSWTFTGNDFDADRNYEKLSTKNGNSFKSILKLKSINENDSGTFNCHIANKRESKNASIELLVQSSAKVESIIHNEMEIDGKLEVPEGSKISIECVVDGYPEPSIFWQKDQEKISEEAILETENVHEHNAGNYECVASNLLGTSSKNFNLFINSLPKSKGNQVTNIQVKEDEMIEIFCDLMGRPEPQIYWKFNSREIENNDKFKVEHRKLSFNASEDDSGIFNCLGVNDLGRTSIDYTVVVMTPPKILSPSDEYLEIKIGSNLSLTCDSIGFPEPQIYFTKNKIKIFNGSNYQNDFISYNDSGIYHCIAENEVGSSEKVFYVSAVEIPRITSYFENITVTTNQTKNIECTSNGIPAPRISWKFLDESSASDDHKLKLTSASKSGFYTCIAENAHGIDKKSIYVEIINKPTMLSTANDLQTSIKIKENDDLELACPFDNFNQISWQLNNKSIINMGHKLIDRKLIIHNVNGGAHGGIWTCTAINTAGNASFSYNVTVLASPTIFASWNLQNHGISDFLVTESDIDERVFKRGERLMLNCTSIGLPPPKIIWKKSTDVIGEGDILVIENLQFYHGDIYTCTAENAQGSVKKFFKIDVVSPPIIDNELNIQKDFQKVIGDSVILRCSSIIANPPPLFFWFKDNELLDDESEDHLEIDSLDVTHDGKYKCLAKNKYGSAKIDFHINMYEPAKILTALEEQKIFNTDDSLHLSCTTRGNPMPIISWTLNGHVMSSTSKLNVEKLFKASQQENIIYFDGFGNGITYLDPFEVKLTKQKFYSKLTRIDGKTLKLEMIFKGREKLKNTKFTCYGFNAMGRDEKSVEVTINRRPYLKERNKKVSNEIEILEHLPLLLTCLIDGEPEPKITWYKNGFQVYENETLKFLNDNKFLSIPESFSWNSGNYSCIGKNSAGELELKFHVDILAPPKFSDYSIKSVESRFYNDKAKVIKSSDNEEVIHVIKGEDVILECLTEASPKPKIHWVKLNFLDSKKNEILTENGNVMAINSIQESANFLCYANNTIGNVQKFFFVQVQYPPNFIDGKVEEHLTVKLNHGLNFECKVRASPEAVISWSYNSSRNVNDFYFSSSNEIMRIVSAHKQHEGKFICTATNDHGTLQKVFYVKVEIPIQFSPWSEWSQCSATCGQHGVQYRSRTCILLDGNPSYNCSGENIQMRKCNDINCPINGGYSSFSKWSACPSCYNENNEIPKQSRYRKCDSPTPAFGGLYCDGPDKEERTCEIEFCPINGGWSEWSNWSECSKTCGRGTKKRERYCNNPTPKYNGRMCVGDNAEYEQCKIRVCSNYDMRKAINNEIENSDESTERFKEFAEFEMIHEKGQPRIFQFMQHREVEYSPQPLQNNRELPKSIKVTLDTYRPISAETYHRHVNVNTNDDDYFEPEFSDSIEFTSSVETTTQRACGRGFKYNSSLKQCEEIDECKMKHLNNCKIDEKCVNTVGSYRCEKLRNG